MAVEDHSTFDAGASSKSSSQQPLIIHPLHIDLCTATEAGKCEHFSIRGYVAQKRKKEKNICLPFHMEGNPDYKLPPLHVPNFRWWRCSSCIHDLGAASPSPNPHERDQVTVLDTREDSKYHNNERQTSDENNSVGLCVQVEKNHLLSNGQKEMNSDLSKPAIRGDKIGSKDYLCHKNDFGTCVLPESGPIPNQEMHTNIELHGIALPGVSAPMQPDFVNEEVIEVQPALETAADESPEMDESAGDDPLHQMFEILSGNSRRKSQRVRLLSELLNTEGGDEQNSPRVESSLHNIASTSEALTSVSPCLGTANKKSRCDVEVIRNKRQSSNLGVKGKQPMPRSTETEIQGAQTVGVSGTFIRDPHKERREEAQAKTTMQLHQIEKKSSLSKKRNAASQDGDMHAVLKPNVDDINRESSTRRIEVENLEVPEGNQTCSEVELDLRLNSYSGAEINHGIENGSLRNNVGRKEECFVGDSSRSPKSTPNHIQTFPSGTKLTNGSFHLQHRPDPPYQLKGAAEDIPMEIVELMAKHQYERNVSEVRSCLHQGTGSSSRSPHSPVVTMGMIPRAETSGVTGVNHATSSHHEGNYYSVRPQSQPSPRSAFNLSYQNQLRPTSGIRFPNPHAHKNSNAQNGQWSNYIFAHRQSPSNAHVLQPAEGARNVRAAVAGNTLLFGHNIFQNSPVQPCDLGNHPRASEPDLGLHLNASILQQQQSRKVSPPSSNEVVPAMQLLGLMDGGNYSSAPSSMGGNKPFYPFTSHSTFSLGGGSLFYYTGLNPDGRQPLGSTNHQPSVQTRNGLSAGADHVTPSLPSANQFSSLFSSTGNMWRPTNLCGQFVSSTKNHERTKSSNVPTKNLDQRFQESPVVGESISGNDRIRGSTSFVQGTVGTSRFHNGSIGFCTINMNPADFISPAEGNGFMIRGEALKPLGANSCSETVSLNLQGARRQTVPKMKPSKHNV